MAEEKKKINVSRRLFKIAVGYNYQEVVSESSKVLTTKAEPEKVPCMMGTFLAEIAMVSRNQPLKTKPEKVPCMVGTFLNYDGDSFQKCIKKVTNTVGTFLNKGRECHKFIIIPSLTY